jgi:hypothetical protein
VTRRANLREPQLTTIERSGGVDLALADGLRPSSAADSAIEPSFLRRYVRLVQIR